MPTFLRSLIVTLSPFWPQMRPFRLKYIGLIFLQISITVLSLAPPLLAKYAIDFGIHQKRPASLTMLSLLSIVAILCTSSLNSILEFWHETISAKFTAGLREHIFSMIQRRSYETLSGTQPGLLISRVHDDVESVYKVVVNICLDAVNEVLQIVVISAILFRISPSLALLVIAAIPLLAWLLDFASSRLQSLSFAVRDSDVRLVQFLQDSIMNIYAIKVFALEKRFDAQHKHINEECVTSVLARVKVRFLFLFATTVLTSVVPIVVIWAGGMQVIAGTLSFGGLFAVYAYSVRLYTPVQSLLVRLTDVASSATSAALLHEYLVPDGHLAKIRALSPIDRPSRGVWFDNVSYRFPGNPRGLLETVNVHISPGETIAIVGPSGAGKTTFANLLARLYRPSAGTIRLDGVSLDKFDEREFTRRIGLAPQEPQLFDMSIKENIRVALPNASEEDIVSAAKLTQADEFIRLLPDGYDTNVGSRGYRLSGGERQRIALARLALQDPVVRVLDEATSGLDLATEMEVLSALLAQAGTRTTILITHRESVAAFADRILRINDGCIVEESPGATTSSMIIQALPASGPQSSKAAGSHAGL